MSQLSISLVSHHRNKIVKVVTARSVIQCWKIFTFAKNDIAKVELYKDFFENVKDWFKRRYRGTSSLIALDVIQIKEERVIEGNSEGPKQTLLKIITNFNNWMTIEAYYERMQQSQQKIVIDKTVATYLYYFQQFFEVILRGGSIDNFFYSTRNIFISRPIPLSPMFETAKLHVNYLSTVGLQLLAMKGNISKTDLEEIFMILPTRLKSLLQKNDRRQINRVIKIKAFGWNVLAFILRYVPNVLMRSNLNTIVTHQEVLYLLSEHVRGKICEQLLREAETQIQEAEIITGIPLRSIFVKIFIQDCQQVSFQTIFNEFFVNNLKEKDRRNKLKSKERQQASISPMIQQSQERIEQMRDIILNKMWQSQQEEQRRFYQYRGIRKASVVYFLMKANVSFRSVIRQLNAFFFMNEPSLSSDILKVHYELMKNYCKQQAMLESKQNKEKEQKMEQKQKRCWVHQKQAVKSGLKRIIEKEGMIFEVQHEMNTSLLELNNRSWNH